MIRPPEGTVVAALERAAAEFGARPAVARRSADGWVTTSWRDYRDEIFRAAADGGLVEQIDLVALVEEVGCEAFTVVGCVEPCLRGLVSCTESSDEFSLLEQLTTPEVPVKD